MLEYFSCTLRIEGQESECRAASMEDHIAKDCECGFANEDGGSGESSFALPRPRLDRRWQEFLIESRSMKKSDQQGARSRARELIVQSLYQMQITGHDEAELKSQFHERPDYQRVDQDYYDELLGAILGSQEELEKAIDELADRPVANLDPIEKSILLLGFHELKVVADVPFKVVINESVNLAKRFGAVDGHKYINALLDRAAEKTRPGT